jgi:CRISPR-associated protein Csb2
MSLTITVRLRHGRYDAGTGVGRGGEWPPQPARVFCALVASAEAESDWEALRWLESQPPPQVLANPGDRVRSGRVNVYVPENDWLKRADMSGRNPIGSSLEWPARKNGMRSRAHTVPATGSFAISWPEAKPSRQILGRLVSLARTVPYVGRSTSLAEVTVADGHPVRLAGWITYEATGIDDPSGWWQLAVPYPGYTNALTDAYGDGRRSWEVARPVTYREADASGGDSGCRGHDAAPTAGPFGDLLVWGLATRDRGLDGGQAAMLTQALRAAVMRRVPDPLPPQLTGHDAQNDTHLAYLVLPDVDHEHADGHVLGLAIAIPRTYPAQDQATLLRSVLAKPLNSVDLPGGAVIRLQYGADRRGLRPGMWTGGRRGACTWVTATPMRLNGYMRPRRSIQKMVSQALVRSGYPEPVCVDTSPAPMLSGAVWRARPATLPANRKPYPFTHARVTFAKPVTGPVIAGSMRYLGLGLFLPLSERAQEQGQEGLQKLGELVAS